MPHALYQPFPMAGRNRGQIWRYQPQYRRPRHFHGEPELNLVGRGSGRLAVGTSEFSVAAGDLCWFLPGQDHALLEASNDFQLYVVGLTPEFSARVLGAPHASLAISANRVKLCPEDFARLRELCETPLASADPLALEQGVGELWQTASPFRLTRHDLHPATRRTLTTLFDQPHLTRIDASRQARSDPSELSRLFHRDVGHTLSGFRTRLKLLRFIELVDGGIGNFTTAGLQAGFGSYSQCHRTFWQAFGCTPRHFFGQSELRAQMRDALSPAEASLHPQMAVPSEAAI